MKKHWLASLMPHQYKKLPVTMKTWMQFNVMPRTPWKRITVNSTIVYWVTVTDTPQSHTIVLVCIGFNKAYLFATEAYKQHNSRPRNRSIRSIESIDSSWSRVESWRPIQAESVDRVDCQTVKSHQPITRN